MNSNDYILFNPELFPTLLRLDLTSLFLQACSSLCARAPPRSFSFRVSLPTWKTNSSSSWRKFASGNRSDIKTGSKNRFELLLNFSRLGWMKTKLQCTIQTSIWFLVPVDSGKPVSSLRLDSLHLYSDSSDQWNPLFWHHSTLGRHWLAPHHLHGMSF